MTVTEFTPFSAIAGGAMIGLAAVLLMWTKGRIAGASGIFAGLLTFNFDEEFRWRFVFIIGLMIGAAVSGSLFSDISSIAFNGGAGTIVPAGVIVGIGTVLGSGCTSGHGICGISRFSKRSFLATCTFMVVAVMTVFITRHALGA
jgi:uncharacterized protein